MFLGVEASILYFGTLIPHDEKYLGISITEKNVKKTDKDTYLLSVSAEINNQEMFDDSALEAYLGTGGNEDEFKMLNNDQKLAEIVLLSNNSPSPSDVGLVINKVMFPSRENKRSISMDSPSP